MSLTITNPLPALTYSWYSVATGGTRAWHRAQRLRLSGVTATTTYYVEAASGTCTSAGRTTVTVTVNPVPPAVTVDATTKGGTCAGNTASLHVTNAQPSLAYRWYDVPTGGTVLSTNTTYVTGPITANKDFYVEALNSTNCTSTTRTRVSVTITSGPAVTCSIRRNGNRMPRQQGYLPASLTRARTCNTAGTTRRSEATLLFTGTMYTTASPLTTRDTVYVEAVVTGGTCASNGRSQQ